MTTATAPLAYHPFFQKDLSQEISHLRWQGYKHEILAVISIVALVVISAVGFFLAAFFSFEALPVVTIASGALLKVVHSTFFHPYRLEAAKYWEELERAKAVQDLTQTLTQEDVAKIAHKMGVTIPPEGLDFTPIAARYKVLQKESNALLKQIDTLFHSTPKYSDDTAHKPENYTALEECCKQSSLYPKYFRRLKVANAMKYKLEDQYLEKRLQQIYLTHIATNPTETKSFAQAGICFAGEFPEDREAPIFIVCKEDTSRAILRGDLLNFHPFYGMLLAHWKSLGSLPTEVSQNLIIQNIFNSVTPTFSEEDLHTLTAFISSHSTTPLSDLYLDEVFAPFVEQLVNQNIRPLFA